MECSHIITCNDAKSLHGMFSYHYMQRCKIAPWSDSVIITWSDIQTLHASIYKRYM